MKKPARSNKRKKSRKAKWLLYILAIAIAGGTIVSAHTVSNSMTQVAAAAASNDGKCQKGYDECMKDAIPGHKVLGPEYCEQSWKSCIESKCGVNTNKQENIMSCSKDSDCLSSCTESATTKGGLQSCCLDGPKHNNTCRTKIDGKCTNQGSLPKQFIGRQFNEGDVIPSPLQAEKFPEQPQGRMFPQYGDIISPSFPRTYPQGTTFDENGIPSNPPGPNPINPSVEMWPGGLANLPEMGDPGYISRPAGIPPEYEPTSADTAQLNQILANSRKDLSPSSPSIAPSSPIQQGPTSKDLFAPTTFSPNNVESPVQIPPSTNTCHFRVFGWCLW